MIDVKIALRSLRATRVRTALTIFGIVIGVASVTAVLALGEGARAAIKSQVSQLGENVLTIRSGKGTRDSQGNLIDYNFWSALGTTTISEYDFRTVQDVKSVKAAAPIMAITGSIRTDENSPPLGSTNIIATTPDLAPVAGLKLHAGEFINDSAERNTVILGNDLAIQMLGTDTSLGHTIYLRGQPFTVIGVLNKYNSPTNLSNIYDYNRSAFVPMDAGKAFNQGIAQIQQINVRSTSGSNVKETAQAIRTAILKNHNGEDDFVVLRPEEALTLTDTLLRMLTQFSSAIASISLFVGGVGIMNIMLVSVAERTREIGVRKAVGATNAQILRQFLIESLVMSIVGGLIGVALAYGAALIIGMFVHIMPIINWQIFGAAMLIATVVGVIFGVTPALKASRKDPIEALRQIQ